MNSTPNQPHQFDRVIPMAEVAQILNRSLKTLWRWQAKEKIIPEPLKVNGRAIGYRASTVEAILNSLEGGK
ncbi:helix-turn-helix transcriptional regulator [Vibrio furnissii]|uniref:helix-turn-helix transcriptional regulator n=1 Tax=Vibrio furnissii TaxID=29494 RepID=UPI00399C2D6D